VVYNANKLAKLVKEKAKMHNWLDYYQLRFERNASKRPTTKVIPHTKNSCSFPSYGFVIFESNMNPFKKNYSIFLELSCGADWFSWLFWYEGGCH
jgi:hypothetical protein